MSRHRMVRNLTEDDYDDYYDDDYYDDDDYEDYDNSYVAPSKKGKAQPSKSAAAAATAKGSKTPPPNNNTNNTISAKVAFANKKPAVSTTNINAAPAGVAKPPPGWGKPGPPKPATGGSAGHNNAGVSKPPPGWGKPDGAGSSAVSPIAASKDNNGTEDLSSKSSARASSEKKVATKSQWQHPFQKPLPAFLQERSSIASQLSMVVLGHVDAGKSTMMGQLLVQTGKITKRHAQKQEQLAWLLDENESERARGVTQEIGTKAVSTQNHQIIVLDAPGHADFIPIMITGAANADTCILVVDSVTGEFEAGFSGGGQTKEHILLAKGLGVSQVIIAINKMDVEGWKQDRYDYISQLTLDYLTRQHFKAARIQCVPVSGLSGENVQAQTEPLLRQWYSGPTLLQAIDRLKPANRQLEKPLRFTISDMFAEGKGVVARGRVAQGFVQVGDKVKVMPLGDDSLVSRLEHLQPPEDGNERLTVAIAGDTVEIVLANVDPLRVSIGDVVVDRTHWPPVNKKARAKILIMDDLAVPIIRGAQVLFHMHSIDVPAVITKMISTLKADGSVLKERPRALTKGTSAMVELKLNKKIVMETFQNCRALGRFVLRRGGDTIAIGVIEEIIL